jgi:hypothetical protein
MPATERENAMGKEQVAAGGTRATFLSTSTSTTQMP